jgi:C4-dicarboxylate-specific signal transduction histidine kinase
VARLTLGGVTAAWVSGDASHLDQVVPNLIDNAVKYSEPDSPVEIDVSHAQGGVMLTVRDLDGAAERLAADAYLAKPFRLDEMLSTVNRLLDDHRAGDAAAR